MAPNSRLSHYLVFKDQAVVRLKIDRDGKKNLLTQNRFPVKRFFNFLTRLVSQGKVCMYRNLFLLSSIFLKKLHAAFMSVPYVNKKK
jgi:hypothetical protein